MDDLTFTSHVTNRFPLCLENRDLELTKHIMKATIAAQRSYDICLKKILIYEGNAGVPLPRRASPKQHFMLKICS